MIRLHKVTKTFAGKQVVHALRGIDLTIPTGQIYGIIGQSGAGKSTLIRCINMLERPDQGEVWIGDILLNNLKQHELAQVRKEIGMVFQHFNLLSSRTVAANIAYPMEIVGTDRASIKKNVANLLELVDLTDKADSYPAQLSGGQKQRVGIARALANNPHTLLCDEATSALDPDTTKSILNLLRTIQEERGLTIVLITHEMQVIQDICDSVAVLEEGVVHECGPVIDVFTNPKTQATQKLMQSSWQNVVSLNEHRNEEPGAIKILLKLNFIGTRAHKPIISQMIKVAGVDANIIFGRIDQMKDTPFGMLVVELTGTNNQVETAINFLNHHKVELEVVS